MKKISSIIIVSLTFIILVICVTCNATSKKVEKPKLVYSEKDSDYILEFDEESCDSISYHMERVEDSIVGNGAFSMIGTDYKGEKYCCTDFFGGIYSYEYCLQNDKGEKSDTLYVWKISRYLNGSEQIMLTYDDGKLNIFGKYVGDSISFYDDVIYFGKIPHNGKELPFNEKKLIGKTKVEFPVTEYPISDTLKSVVISIKQSENGYLYFNIPIKCHL